MWTKAITFIAHFSVFLLAMVLIGTIASKEVNTASLEALKKEFKTDIQRENKDLNSKILSLKENLETYQATREARAKLYAERIDKLYNLYNENASVIEQPRQTSVVIPQSPENFSYLETRINKVNGLVDERTNSLESRLGVLETKVKNLETENRELKIQQRVVNNNLNNNVVNVQK